MTTRTDADFWLNEADADVDICDKRLSVEDFTALIFPEIPADPKSILEIGCGIGRLTNEVKKHYPKAFVAGTDINPDFLKKAEQLSGYTSDKSNPTKYPFYYCRDDIIGVPKQDFIYSVLVFQHLSNEAKAEYIKQAGQALRKNGAFLFQYVEGDHASRAMYDAKIADVRLWCEEAGLEIENIKTDTVCERWTWVKAVKK